MVMIGHISLHRKTTEQKLFDETRGKIDRYFEQTIVFSNIFIVKSQLFSIRIEIFDLLCGFRGDYFRTDF